jgi:WD40 repeat protein
MRYDAFISYSHAADNVAAPALQRALHAFARPWNRLRALYVFRDQTSLAASPELWPAIEAALADARWLLLMASPEAAASRWVAREIDWWLTHRSPKTLLIILTGGELGWDYAASDFDWRRTTCLPREVVTRRFPGEPLWVDLCWAKSADVLTLRHARFRLAVLDVAAPLHGRPKDELDGEDVRRFARMQRLRAGAIAALVMLTVVAGAAAWIAIGQRNEARRQATIAHASRLSAQADQMRERGGPTDASVMLGAEALRLLDGIGERSADVDQSLRRALAGLPELRGAFDISAEALRLTPDATMLVASHTGNQTSVHAVPYGRPLGCMRDAIQLLRRPAAGERLWLIDAVSDDGAWCVVHSYFEGTQTEALELWSAEPLRQAARVTLASQAGHVHPSIAPGGRWLAATDVPQSGDVSASVAQLWEIGADGIVGLPTMLPGMALIAFAPDGRHVATSAGLWRIAERGQAGAPGTRTIGLERRITWDAVPWKVAFTPDGGHVATQAGPDAKVVIWDVATGKDELRASPPRGELLALGPGGTRLIVVGAADSTVWDGQLDVARAILPQRADAAALPRHGDALFAVHGSSPFGQSQLRFLALPEEPVALRATVFPGAVESVQAMRLLRGVVNFIELVGAGERADRASPPPRADGDRVRLHRWDPLTDTWETTVIIDGVTAFALTPDEDSFAAAASGQVVIRTGFASGPVQPLAPAVAADRLAFSGGGSYVLAYASAPEGGTLHVWQRDKGEHWSVPIDSAPSTMAVTRDGRFALAAVAHGTATRGGVPYQLLRWRLGDPEGKAVLELSRSLNPPVSICGVLADTALVATTDGGALGVSRADVAECSTTDDTTRNWLIAANDRQVTVFAPSGADVARIDHAAKVLRAALSTDGREAVTLDETGRVQRFAVDPKDLLAQVCRRQPEQLGEGLRATLPAQVKAIDACGRTVEEEGGRPAKR